MKEKMAEEIALFITAEAVTNSIEGNWAVYLYEIANEFGITEKEVENMSKDILEELKCRNEILDVYADEEKFDVDISTDYLEELEEY